MSDWKMPEVGDIVRCNYNFEEERNVYKVNYPKNGDYLTVSAVVRNENDDILLFFEELRLSIALVAVRFDVVQREADGDDLLNQAYKIANGI